MIGNSGNITLKTERVGRKPNKYGVPLISGKQYRGPESENLAIPALMWLDILKCRTLA
jgi:hypothetical protein